MRWYLPLVLLLLFVASPPSRTLGQGEAQPTEPKIVDLIVENDNRQVLFSFKLVGAFDESLRRRIESGVPTSLLYRMQLVRDRKRWFDKTVLSSTLQVIAMYNAITREYLINYKHNGDLVDSRLVRDPRELEEAMTRFERFVAIGLEPEVSDQRILGRVRAELGTRTVFFFIPTTLTTDWAQQRLRLGP